MARSKGVAPKRIRRPARVSGRRSVICQLAGDNTGNSSTDAQVQFLSSRFHLRPSFARAVA